MSIVCFSACKEENASESSVAEKQENTIEFVQSEISLSIGDSVQAEVTTSKSNVYVFFSIRDKELATVSSSGVITALAEGQTICYAEFGGKTAVCLIKITAKGAEPELSVSVPYAENKVTLYAGETLNLKVAAKLGDTAIDGVQIEYEVADVAIANVDNGVLNAVAVGETTVKIKASYEGKEASLTLNVKVVEKTV